MHDNRKPSKVIQKDRYGNSVTMEYAPDTKPLDPTALAKHAMEQGMEVPQISMTSMEPPMMDHPGGPKGSDTVPAWLTPGEFVVNAEAMRIPGAKEQIESINNQGRAQQKMQGGSIPSGYNHGGAVDMTGPISQPYGMGYMLGGNVEGAGQDIPIAGYQQGGQIPAPFIAGPRLNDPMYADDGGPAELSPLLQLYSQLTGVGQQRGTTQNDVWRKSPEQIARDNAPWWESNPDLFKDDGGWVTDALLDRLAEVESGGDNDAVSPVGALGMYQWMPKSAAQAGYGVKPFNPLDPKAARAATKKYLENMAKHHGFTPEETLRAYNWGPGNVINYNKGKRKDIPDEALNYPGKILGIDNTQGVTPPPGEAPALPRARPGQQYDRLSDIPKQDLHRYVQPAVEQPTPRPAQLTAEDIAGLDEDINYANKGGNIGSLKNILRDPTLIPRLIEAGQKVAPLFAEEGAEVPIQSNFLNRVYGEGNDPAGNVVPALTDVPGNPMYENQNQDKPVDFGEEVPELDAFGDEGRSIPSEYWRSKYDETHPDFVPQHGEGKTESDKKALDRAQELLDNADPSDPTFDAKVGNVSNLKKTLAESQKKDEMLVANKAQKEKVLDADKKAAMKTKKEALIQKALEAGQNGDWEAAELINDQIDAIDKKELTTPDKEAGETKLDKKKQVVGNIEKKADADPVLKNKGSDEVNGAGEKSSPEEKKKTEGLLEGLFGDLFDKKELARMAVVYLGGRALGGSHQGSLGYAAKAYLQRVDTNAANEKAHINKLISGGKYTPASVEAYKESKDVTDLKAIGDPITRTGQFKNFYKNGTKVRATQVKSGKNTYWVTPDGKQINATYQEDASTVKGTPEYSARVIKDSGTYTGMIKDLRKQFGTIKIKDAADQYKTELAPSVSGGEIAKWAADNGVPADLMPQIVNNAYHNAVKYSEQSGKKVRNLSSYLNDQYVIATSGSNDLFKDPEGNTITGTRVSGLIKQVTGVARARGKEITPSQAVAIYRTQWNKLDQKTRDKWQSRSQGGTTENGFMKFMENDLKPQ